MDDDASTLKKQFPKIDFISVTSSFWKVAYQRSPTSRVKIKATLTFPNGYESSNNSAGGGVVVSVEGGGTTNVPPGLKRKLEKDLGDAAKTATSTCKDAVSSILTKLIDFIDTNHFVPCWKELRQVVDLINNNQSKPNDVVPADTIRMKETTGKIWLSLNTKAAEGDNKIKSYYQYKCVIQIDPEYPNTANLSDYGKPCRLQQLATTAEENGSRPLPESVSSVITQQGQELVRRLQDGMTNEHALLMSNPIHLPPSTPQTDEETPDEAWQRHDLERRKYYGIPTAQAYDGSQPQLSLLPLVEFLHKTIHRLSNQKCPNCNRPSLSSPSPTPPKATAKSKPKDKQRPILTHSGQWYRWECLDTLMKRPPFGKIDDIIKDARFQSNKPLYHPDWPQEKIPERERAYQQQQAKEREIADAADFF